MLEYISELIYPTTCGICGKICREAICKKCELKLKEFERSHRLHIVKRRGIPASRRTTVSFRSPSYTLSGEGIFYAEGFLSYSLHKIITSFPYHVCKKSIHNTVLPWERQQENDERMEIREKQ